MPAVFRICQTAGGCRLLGQAAPRRPLPQRTTGEVNTVQRRDRLGGLLPLVDDQGAARRAKTDPADFVMLSTKGVSGCLDLNGMRFQSAVGNAACVASPAACERCLRGHPAAKGADQKSGHGSRLWVPTTLRTSCDLLIFVDQAAEPVASSDTLQIGRGVLGKGSLGSGLAQRAMWAVVVVVPLVLPKHGRGVALVDDQEAVEEFSTDRADEAFGDRVGARCLHRRLDDLDVDGGEDGVEGGGELGVAVADEEPESSTGVVEVHEQVAGLLGEPSCGGVGGDAEDVHAAGGVLDDEEDVQPVQGEAPSRRTSGRRRVRRHRYGKYADG